jgi:hypothetical protein
MPNNKLFLDALYTQGIAAKNYHYKRNSIPDYPNKALGASQQTDFYSQIAEYTIDFICFPIEDTMIALNGINQKYTLVAPSLWNDINDWILKQGKIDLKKILKGNELKRVDGIEVLRKEIDLFADDKYGHWWIELFDETTTSTGKTRSNEESYGWWPSKHVGIKETISGVPGDLNGRKVFGGTKTKDAHHGDRDKNVNVYEVYIETIDGRTAEDIKQEIRDFANNYSGNWSWPSGQNCHSFQEELLKKVKLKIRIVK